MNKKITIAAIQLCSSLSVSKNLSIIDGLVKQAAIAGATYILTPEMSLAYAGNAKELAQIAKPYENNPDVRACAKLAKEHQVFLHIGSMAIRLKNGKYANRSILFSPEGEIIDFYDKIHLFDATPPNEIPYRESDNFQAGTNAIIAKCAGFNIGFSICYDLRFASLFRMLAQAGAQIITVPAAFTKPTGEAHWEILLRARSIETGCYIIAAAQGGNHENGRQTWGHSMIIDPWGEVVKQLDGVTRGVIIANIELEKIVKTRQNIPTLENNISFSLSVN